MGRVMMHAKDHHNPLKGVTVFPSEDCQGSESCITLHEAESQMMRESYLVFYIFT